MAEAFTYEDIYELLRSEKFSSDLQELKVSDLQNIRAYLDAKQALLNNQEEDMQVFSSQKRAKIMLEIDNAKRALKDLFENRERKVINRALYSTRTGSKLMDTTNMLKNEEELYKALLTLLENNKDFFFQTLKQSGSAPKPKEKPKDRVIKEPEEVIEKESELEPVGSIEPKEVAPVLAEESEEAKDNVVEQESGLPDKSKSEINLIKIKLKEDLPELIGEDLKTYGPFTAGQDAEVPEKIANLLLDQGKAEQPS